MKNTLYKSTALSAVALAGIACVGMAQPAAANPTPYKIEINLRENPAASSALCNGIGLPEYCDEFAFIVSQYDGLNNQILYIGDANGNHAYFGYYTQTWCSPPAGLQPAQQCTQTEEGPDGSTSYSYILGIVYDTIAKADCQTANGCSGIVNQSKDPDKNLNRQCNYLPAGEQCTGDTNPGGPGTPGR